MTTSKPIAVFISDIHFTVPTLELATQSLLAAKAKASELQVPLIVTGDTLDSKAIMRAECANRLLSIVKSGPKVKIWMLVGNHDLLNEKGSEHSLNFLADYVDIIDKPCSKRYQDQVYSFIPYQTHQDAFKSALEGIPRGRVLITHQGVSGANMGHYTMDASALSKDIFSDFRTISGHYHKRQDIKCGRPQNGAIGLFSYVGNPYTLSFGEANEEKGYQVLNENGLLTFVPLNLRMHRKYEIRSDQLLKFKPKVNKNDLIWLRLIGTPAFLRGVNKSVLGFKLFGTTDYKLELVPSEAEKSQQIKSESPEATLDTIIDELNENNEYKIQAKNKWRDLIK